LKNLANLTCADPMSEDAVALEINEVVTSYGLRITDGKHSKYIKAVSELYAIYNTGGTELIGKTLELLGKCWSDDCQAYQGTFLKGFSHYLCGEQVFSEKVFIKKMQAYTPVTFMAKVREFALENNIVKAHHNNICFANVLDKLLRKRVPNQTA